MTAAAVVGASGNQRRRARSGRGFFTFASLAVGRDNRTLLALPPHAGAEPPSADNGTLNPLGVQPCPPHKGPNGGIRPTAVGARVDRMKKTVRQRVCATIVTTLAAALLFGAPAHADPVSGASSTVDMPLPAAGPPASSGDSRYQPPPVSMSVQDGSGGVDRDGTNGAIDPDGTNGRVTGPLIRAIPAIRAAPAPLSPRLNS